MNQTQYILIDSNVLVALMDPRERQHLPCTKIVDNLIAPLITTQACLTESFYLLGRDKNRLLQMRLWRFVESTGMIIDSGGDSDTDRCHALMRQYDFADYADTTLIALAERRGLKTILTTDGHFYAYRLAEEGTFLVLPGPDR